MQIKLKRIPRVRTTTENQNNIQGKWEKWQEKKQKK